MCIHLYIKYFQGILLHSILYYNKLLRKNKFQTTKTLSLQRPFNFLRPLSVYRLIWQKPFKLPKLLYLLYSIRPRPMNHLMSNLTDKLWLLFCTCYCASLVCSFKRVWKHFFANKIQKNNLKLCYLDLSCYHAVGTSTHSCLSVKQFENIFFFFIQTVL